MLWPMKMLYCTSRCGNVAAILELDEHLQRNFTIFEAAPQVSRVMFCFVKYFISKKLLSKLFAITACKCSFIVRVVLPLLYSAIYQFMGICFTFLECECIYLHF